MKKRLLALILALAMAFTLMACGSSSSDEGADSSAAEDTTEAAEDEESSYVQGVTDTEIIIGNSAATSGSYASVGVPFNAGIQAYLDMVNADGGIDGRTISLVHYDDEYDPVKGKSYLQQLVEDDEIFAYVGGFGTEVVSAILDDLKDYGIPSVYFATGIGDLYAEEATTNEEGYNIFPVQPVYTTEGRVMVARAISMGATKIGIVYTNDDAGTNMYDGAVAQCEETGVEYVAEQVTAGSADVSSAITSIKAEDVDFVIVASNQGTMATIVKEMASQGMTCDAITSYVNAASTMAEAVADDIDGMFTLYSSGWIDLTTDEGAAEYATFVEWVDEEYAANAYAMAGWIAASIFCEGLYRVEENGEELTWASYMAALEESPVSNPFGGDIDYANGKRYGTESMTLLYVNTETQTFDTADALKTIDELLGE